MQDFPPSPRNREKGRCKMASKLIVHKRRKQDAEYICRYLNKLSSSVRCFSLVLGVNDDNKSRVDSAEVTSHCMTPGDHAC